MQGSKRCEVTPLLQVEAGQGRQQGQVRQAGACQSLTPTQGQVLQLAQPCRERLARLSPLPVLPVRNVLS